MFPFSRGIFSWIDRNQDAHPYMNSLTAAQRGQGLFPEEFLNFLSGCSLCIRHETASAFSGIHECWNSEDAGPGKGEQYNLSLNPQPFILSAAKYLTPQH